MDQRLKDQAKRYDLESLKKSLLKHDENIASLALAVERQESAISDEQMMINAINHSDHQGNVKLIEIDTLRLQANISRHRIEIDLFKQEIKDEEERRRDTEQMVMYLEAQAGM